MKFSDCVSTLKARGVVIERDYRPGIWRVFHPPSDCESGEPDLIDATTLVEAVEQMLLRESRSQANHAAADAEGCADVSSRLTGQARLSDGMRHAYKDGDPMQELVPIDQWVVKCRQKVARCVVCHQIVKMKGDLSTKVETHFAHGKGVSCPTMQASSNAFDIFSSVPRGLSSDAESRRKFVLEHLEEIYEKCKSLCPALNWTEFLPLLDEARSRDVWSFKDFDPRLAPYVLLCCAPRFSRVQKKNSVRPNAIFFALEAGASKSEFWHIPHSSKQRIWRVNASTRHAELITMDDTLDDPWYRKSARSRLRLK